MTESFLSFDGRLYKAVPDIALVCEIEAELGGAPALLESLSRGAWKISDLVTLMHMMLAACGQEIDFRTLGNKMIAEGIGKYRAYACDFLAELMQPQVQVPAGVSPASAKRAAA